MSGSFIRRDSFYEVRFWRRVKKRKDGCWVWTGYLNPQGYGVVHCHLSGQLFKSAHRYAYTLEKGPIPEGLHIDHLCCVRNCVNPDHLEAVTPSENARRVWRRSGAPMKNRVVRVDDDVWVAAQRRAEAKGVRLSVEIRKWLERYGKDYREDVA